MCPSLVHDGESSQSFLGVRQVSLLSAKRCVIFPSRCRYLAIGTHGGLNLYPSRLEVPPFTQAGVVHMHDGGSHPLPEQVGGPTLYPSRCGAHA